MDYNHIHCQIKSYVRVQMMLDKCFAYTIEVFAILSDLRFYF